MSFLEKIGILFASTIYIEGIIKDLIIFKRNPELIKEINTGIISEKLISERKKYFKQSFNQAILDEFFELYNLTEEDKKIYVIILLFRDMLGHSRISVEEEKIWYTPLWENKLKKIKAFFGIDGNGDTITTNIESINFKQKIKIIEKIDKEVLPKYAESIGLDYGRLR